MRDVTRKIDTLRTATAQATVHVGLTGLTALKDGTLPKGEPFGICQAAGMLAAKRTSELIPHCHNIPLDSLDVRCVLTDGGVTITAEAKTVWKTGVEMEALTAASVAALTLYDLLKPIESDVTIAETKLLSVKGGKTQFEGLFAGVAPTYAVLVASDRASAGTYDDTSGKRIMEILGDRGATNKFYKVLPDDPDGLAEQLREWAGDVDFVFTTGGTGIAPRDAMVEATLGVIEREVPGIAEAMRNYSQRRKPLAMFSRGTVGTIGKTMVINLPGSPKGVEECLDALLPYVFHAVSELAKEGPVARLSTPTGVAPANNGSAVLAGTGIGAPVSTGTGVSTPVAAAAPATFSPPPPLPAVPSVPASASNLPSTGAPASFGPPPAAPQPPPMAPTVPVASSTPSFSPPPPAPASVPRFDPVTGAPLQAASESPRIPRFDPVTGAPLADTSHGTPAAPAPPPSLGDPFGANLASQTEPAPPTATPHAAPPPPPAATPTNPDDTAMFTLPPPTAP
ncbi:MAG TPA: bifunctional molybdenum cofactor biosynthesis protein MoaC/MoaB [bacterium]|nr:bifunctional molybdenum cofactor biosynthesis protein MoaC/MoaB [bacterium]